MSEWCPPYFIGIRNDGNFSCVPKCPIPYYTDTQYDALATISTVFGILAMVSSFITLVPHFALPSRRAWPHVLLPTLFSCIFILGLHFVFPIAGYRYKWRELVCNKETSIYHTGKTNKWCAFDGIITYIFGIAAVLQWGAIDIYLTLRIFRVNIGTFTSASLTRDSYLSTKIQICLVYAIIVLYILISSIIILVNDGISGSGEGGHCFIKPGKYFKLWVGVLAGIGLLGILNTFIIFGYSCFLSNDTKMALSLIFSQWRILVFRVIFLVAACSLVIFWSVWDPRSEKIQNSIISWLGCTAVTFMKNIQSGYPKTAANIITKNTCDSLLYVPPYNAAFWSILVVPLAAFSFPLLFFFQRDILSWWLNFLSGKRRLGTKLFGSSAELSNNISGTSPKISRAHNSIETWNTDTAF